MIDLPRSLCSINFGSSLWSDDGDLILHTSVIFVVSLLNFFHIYILFLIQLGCFVMFKCGGIDSCMGVFIAEFDVIIVMVEIAHVYI